MASRSNLSGRKLGFGRGMLSKVYGAAQKQAKANRQAGAPPGTRKTTGMFSAGKRKQRLGITQEQADAGITNVDEGRAAAGLPPRSISDRLGLKGGFSSAVRRMKPGMNVAGDVSAPGLDQLTGGGPPVTAGNATPAVMPGSTRVSTGVKRGMGAEGARLLASRGVTPGAPAPSPPASRGGVIERLKKNTPAINPSAMAGGPTPAPVVTPEVTENIAAPESPAALAPGQGSVRSRGMHRSVPRRRAKQDRG